MVADLNCNMVRVWGGGVYEDHAFFDFCDEHGILVWQDFMFACEFPPQEEFFLREVAHEAESVIVKLRNHPSLAVWCGDNETDMAFFFLGHKICRNLLPSHNRVTREVLPLAVRNFDPARDFLPSSPYIADSLIVRRYREQSVSDMLDHAPEQHLYASGPELLEGKFREFYRASAAHFLSETGPIGINAMSETAWIVERELPRIKRLWGVDPQTLSDDSSMSRHQSDLYCAAWCDASRRVTERMFGRKFSPDAPEELTAAVNFYVACLFKFVVESYRMEKFRRTGVIW